MAAHIVGYIGRMTDEGTILRLEQEGYLRTDLIGISGISTRWNRAYAQYRASHRQADHRGQQSGQSGASDRSYRPTSGNNVFLTLDLGLQKVLEEALEQNIKNTYAEQMKAYRKTRPNTTPRWPSGRRSAAARPGGAAVVVDVHTMEILAMCSILRSTRIFLRAG